MAQGVPQTINQSIGAAVEAAMQVVQVAQPQHMVHHMPQQPQAHMPQQVQVHTPQQAPAPQLHPQPQHMVHHMPQQAQAPQVQQQSQNYTYQYVSELPVLQPGENSEL